MPTPTSAECDHLDCASQTCQRCGLAVDAYGNTEGDAQRYCSFPDCGCDGARLCQATEGPSERANGGNVDGMWSGKTRAHRRARLDLVAEVAREARVAEAVLAGRPVEEVEP